MTDKQLIINHNDAETRIALLENSTIAELFIERKNDQGIVGNIYKGIVTRVLPGMNSAFLDIGLAKSAFLFGGDVIDPTATINPREHPYNLTDTEDSRQNINTKPIEKSLREGQSIVVQVSKGPLGTKGPRVTTHLTLPGRYLVLMPKSTHIGISRRIEEEEERERLKSLVEEMLPSEIGIIVRTAAKGVDRAPLENDIKFLQKMWAKVESKINKVTPPERLYQDLNIIKKNYPRFI